MAWWRAESPSARRAREQAEQLARLDVLPLALADAAVAKLTGLPPIGDRDPATYTDAFVQRYEGWTFNGLRFDHRRRAEGIVAWLEEFPVSCHEGSAIRSDGTSPPQAASMAHLALRELQITADDVAAIEKDVSTWSRTPGLRPEPPPSTPGPEAFELDLRPRAWALVGSAVTLLAATMVLVTLARIGGPALWRHARRAPRPGRLRLLLCGATPRGRLPRARDAVPQSRSDRLLRSVERRAHPVGGAPRGTGLVADGGLHARRRTDGALGEERVRAA